MEPDVCFCVGKVKLLLVRVSIEPNFNSKRKFKQIPISKDAFPINRTIFGYHGLCSA